LEDNMDIMHAMKDALMKYETIDAGQLEDLMARKDEIREPQGWTSDSAEKVSQARADAKAAMGADKAENGQPKSAAEDASVETVAADIETQDTADNVEQKAEKQSDVNKDNKSE